MNGRLSKKTAFVTGASRGIGRAVALAFAREGAALVLCSRNQAELDGVAREARDLGARVVAQNADVTDLGRIDRLIAQSLKEFGRIDILVNNAAVLGPHRDAVDVERREWEETLKPTSPRPSS